MIVLNSDNHKSLQIVLSPAIFYFNKHGYLDIYPLACTPSNPLVVFCNEDLAYKRCM